MELKVTEIFYNHDGESPVFQSIMALFFKLADERASPLPRQYFQWSLCRKSQGRRCPSGLRCATERRGLLSNYSQRLDNLSVSNTARNYADTMANGSDSGL
jgi:hypothetical protein